MLGIPALGVVDRNSLAGIVRAHEAAKTTACGWSSAAGSILRMARRCWSIRRTAPPMGAFAGF